jgi:hypothetical protein
MAQLLRELHAKGGLRRRPIRETSGVKAYMVATATKVRSSYAGTLQRKLAPASPGVLSSGVPLTVSDPLKSIGVSTGCMAGAMS